MYMYSICIQELRPVWGDFLFRGQLLACISVRGPFLCCLLPCRFFSAFLHVPGCTVLSLMDHWKHMPQIGCGRPPAKSEFAKLFRGRFELQPHWGPLDTCFNRYSCPPTQLWIYLPIHPYIMLWNYDCWYFVYKDMLNSCLKWDNSQTYNSCQKLDLCVAVVPLSLRCAMTTRPMYNNSASWPWHWFNHLAKENSCQFERVHQRETQGWILHIFVQPM